jgi:hypothetical protein
MMVFQREALGCDEEDVVLSDSGNIIVKKRFFKGREEYNASWTSRKLLILMKFDHRQLSDCIRACYVHSGLHFGCRSSRVPGHGSGVCFSLVLHRYVTQETT